MLDVKSDVTVLRNMTTLVLLTSNLTSIHSRNSVGVPLSSSVEDLIRTLSLYPHCFEYLSLRCIIPCSIHLNHLKPLFHATMLFDTMFPECRVLSPVVKICLMFTPPLCSNSCRSYHDMALDTVLHGSFLISIDIRSCRSSPSSLPSPFANHASLSISTSFRGE